MTTRRPCPPAPGPLEDFAAQFDALFHSLAQRRSFRLYLAGLLAPRDRPKTLTALAGAEPVVQAQAAPVQQMQFFLSESNWDADQIAGRTLQLLLADPLIAPTAGGVLVIDDTGDRKDGCATDHVARQYLGSVGKIDNGIVAVTTLWANEQRYYPLHVIPYTPERRLPEGKQDPAFHTKPQLALDLIRRAQAAGITFEAIVADSAYGDNRPFVRVLNERELPYVLAHSGKVGRGWAPAHLAHSFEDAAREVPLRAWQRIVRRFRDGHTQRWWVAELTLFKYGPDGPIRAICATTDRRTLPDLNTWYLTTTLSREQAPLSEVVRLYGLRNWIEQSYKQMKDQLGWADFMVRSDRAIRRHWTLVCCAFAFCWWHEAYEVHVHEEVTPKAAEKKHARPTSNAMLLAAPTACHSGMDDPGTLAHVLLGRLFEQAPSARDRRTANIPHFGLRY
jgi:SRSO17 transposase